jgi:hypothetical protein
MQEIEIAAAPNWFSTLFYLVSEEYIFIQYQPAIAQIAVEDFAGN